MGRGVGCDLLLIVGVTRHVLPDLAMTFVVLSDRLELGPFVLIEEGLLDRLLKHQLKHLLVLEVNEAPLSLEFRLIVKQKLQ